MDGDSRLSVALWPVALYAATGGRVMTGSFDRAFGYISRVYRITTVLRARWHPIVKRLVITAVACGIAALIAHLALRGVYGQRSAYVYVRWSANVAEHQRQSLEQQHKLEK